jgi:outer membrane lipoprotein SlyB
VKSVKPSKIQFLNRENVCGWIGGGVEGKMDSGELKGW